MIPSANNSSVGLGSSDKTMQRETVEAVVYRWSQIFVSPKAWLQIYCVQLVQIVQWRGCIDFRGFGGRWLPGRTILGMVGVGRARWCCIFCCYNFLSLFISFLSVLWVWIVRCDTQPTIGQQTQRVHAAARVRTRVQTTATEGRKARCRAIGSLKFRLRRSKLVRLKAALTVWKGVRMRVMADQGRRSL